MDTITLHAGSLDELIEALEEARESKGGDAQVRVAYQQNYPLRGSMVTVTMPADEDEYPEGEHALGQEQDMTMVWIALGSPPYEENPYGPEWAWGQHDE